LYKQYRKGWGKLEPPRRNEGEKNQGAAGGAKTGTSATGRGIKLADKGWAKFTIALL
jgi:hypothetical protein